MPTTNGLRTALRDKGWSYARLAAELRRHATGSALPKTESLVALISRWVNDHQQPDDFYRDLLAQALGAAPGRAVQRRGHARGAPGRRAAMAPSSGA